MAPEQIESIDDLTGPDEPTLDDVTGYEDGDGFVVCDKQNANAWIRTENATPLTQ